jgi:hypothetical protein
MNETEPTPEAMDKIRTHLATMHGRSDFDLHRDVAFRDNDPEGAQITYLAETSISAPRFVCAESECAGRIFVAGEPTYGHPERNSMLLFAHPELRTTLLAGVGDPADRAMLLEDWDRGRLGQLQVKAAHTRRSMSTKKQERPRVEERRTRCQKFMLARVREGTTVKDAIAALDALRNDDLFAYERLMCGPDILKPETLKKYWGKIPIAVRSAARTEGARARATRAP